MRIIKSVQYGNEADLVVAFVTSNTANQQAYDVLIDDNHVDYTMTGLNTTSVIRTHKIITLSESEVSAQLGALGPQHQADLKAALKQTFDL